MLHRSRNIARKLICCGTFFAAVVGPAAAADPTGDWRVADGVANIRVAECNGGMWGAVAWEKDPGGIDKNNPDVAKQTRPTLGMPILLDMKKKPSADQWEGQVYNAKDGKLYSSTIRLSTPDQLEIRGCVLGFLCGGETWTRVAGPIPSSPSNPPAKGLKATIAKAIMPKPKAAPKTVAAPGQPPDIGDICLLPDIAGLAH
jgi:uncharacterized protein (DUF2147 family)